MNSTVLPVAAAFVFGLSPLAQADNDEFTSQVAPTWRGEVGADFLGFDVFTEAVDLPNAPDLVACGAATLTGLEATALITSTGNIYSFVTETEFRIDYAGGGELQAVSLQLRVLGAPLDEANVRIVPLDALGQPGAPIFADLIQPLGAVPGELQFTWDSSLLGLTAGDFELYFEAASSSMSLDVALLDVRTDRGSLTADTTSVSLGTGGTQALAIDAGSANAGNLYLVLGSRTGTAPGVPIDGVTVPLNLDGYTLFTIEAANGPVFQNSLASLDACGRGSAAIAVPAGLSPALAGATLHHAAVVIDPLQFVTVFATDAAPLALQN